LHCNKLKPLAAVSDVLQGEKTVIFISSSDYYFSVQQHT